MMRSGPGEEEWQWMRKGTNELFNTSKESGERRGGVKERKREKEKKDGR